MNLIHSISMFFTLFGSLKAFMGFRDEGDYRDIYGIVCMSIGVAQYEHVLPYYLGLVENLKYPKDRIRISFFVDTTRFNPEDKTEELIKKWMKEVTKHYLSVSLESVTQADNWRELALVWSRRRTCAHALIASADHFLMENSLRKLITLDKTVVSPLMNAPFENYSNVHGILGDDFVYRQELESVRVYFLYGPYLINLKHKDSSYLTFDTNNVRDYNGRQDPIFVFAYSAYNMQIPIYVDNRHFYGYLLDSSYYTPKYHKKMFGYFLANLVSEFGMITFPHSSYIEPTYPEPSRFGFEKIYLINLRRRPERLRKMDLIFKLLGIDYTVFEAVDGQHLTPEELEEVEFLPGYEDPYYKRPMKRGEIGCFLSHYRIWEDVVKNQYSRVIVFEDDVKFIENSTIELMETVEDLMKTRTEWDFIYLGRKKMTPHGDEFYVPGHRYLSTINYSYWTLGYALSLSGASKLIQADPLSKLMAIDEFLPIMYDKHPNKQWSAYFSKRDLQAYAVYPVIVVPERYTHQPGYVSDTEDSYVVEETFDKGENGSETGMGCTTSTLDFEIDGHQISIVKEITAGGFSQIFLAQDISSKEKFAVKRITCSSNAEINRVRQEISIHRQLGRYDHALRLVGAFEEIDPRGQYGRFSIVMPLCEHGSLYDELLRRSKTKNFMDLPLILTLFSQMCKAVSYLHHSRPPIAHRDIKPGNFLFEKSNSISLIDFGSCMPCPIHIADGRKSREMIDESAEFCSMTYRPPELFTCEIGTTLTEKIDIWSLGCVLYALCYFVSPFDKVFERGDSVALAAQSARLDFDPEAPYDASMHKLIRDILKVDPEERPSVDQVQRLLHAFTMAKSPQNGRKNSS